MCPLEAPVPPPQLAPTQPPGHQHREAYVYSKSPPGRLPAELPGQLPRQLPGQLPDQLPPAAAARQQLATAALLGSGAAAPALPGQPPGQLPGQLPGQMPPAAAAQQQLATAALLGSGAASPAAPATAVPAWLSQPPSPALGAPAPLALAATARPAAPGGRLTGLAPASLGASPKAWPLSTIPPPAKFFFLMGFPCERNNAFQRFRPAKTLLNKSLRSNDPNQGCGAWGGSHGAGRCVAEVRCVAEGRCVAR